MDEPEKTTHNERWKLFATTLNNLGLAMIIGAVIGPSVAGTLEGGRHVLVVIAWALFAVALHLNAHFALGELK
jgi:hypothetical protein